MNYCKECAIPLLGGWRGWPLRDPIPLLPLLGEEGCASCGAMEPGISSEDIQWLNYHGPYNTGLPDYWLLVSDQKTVWGRPYHSELACRRCNGRAVLSEHGDTRKGSFEYKVNCPKCGLLAPRPNISLQRTALKGRR